MGLDYTGESGFSCQPCVPDAWQEVGATGEVNSERSARLNVLGLLGIGEEFEAFAVVGPVNTKTVVGCEGEFVEGISGPTVLVLDNAPTHTSAEFEARVEGRSDRGLELYYLPA